MALITIKGIGRVDPEAWNRRLIANAEILSLISCRESICAYRRFFEKGGCGCPGRFAVIGRAGEGGRHLAAVFTVDNGFMDVISVRRAGETEARLLDICLLNIRREIKKKKYLKSLSRCFENREEEKLFWDKACLFAWFDFNREAGERFRVK